MRYSTLEGTLTYLDPIVGADLRWNDIYMSRSGASYPKSLESTPELLPWAGRQPYGVPLQFYFEKYAPLY